MEIEYVGSYSIDKKLKPEDMYMSSDDLKFDDSTSYVPEEQVMKRVTKLLRKLPYSNYDKRLKMIKKEFELDYLHKGNTLLHLFAQAKGVDRDKIRLGIETLILTHEFDANSKNYLGETFVHTLIKNGNYIYSSHSNMYYIDIIDVNSVDCNGDTILHCSVKNALLINSHLDFYSTLIEKGFDSTIKNNSGKTFYQEFEETAKKVNLYIDDDKIIFNDVEDSKGVDNRYVDFRRKFYKNNFQAFLDKLTDDVERNKNIAEAIFCKSDNVLIDLFRQPKEILLSSNKWESDLKKLLLMGYDIYELGLYNASHDYPINIIVTNKYDVNFIGKTIEILIKNKISVNDWKNSFITEMLKANYSDEDVLAVYIYLCQNGYNFLYSDVLQAYKDENEGKQKYIEIRSKGFVEMFIERAKNFDLTIDDEVFNNPFLGRLMILINNFNDLVWINDFHFIKTIIDEIVANRNESICVPNFKITKEEILNGAKKYIHKISDDKVNKIFVKK